MPEQGDQLDNQPELVRDCCHAADLLHAHVVFMLHHQLRFGGDYRSVIGQCQCVNAGIWDNNNLNCREVLIYFYKTLYHSFPLLSPVLSAGRLFLVWSLGSSDDPLHAGLRLLLLRRCRLVFLPQIGDVGWVRVKGRNEGSK